LLDEVVQIKPATAPSPWTRSYSRNGAVSPDGNPPDSSSSPRSRRAPASLSAL
jgi:hypothetical protein